MHEDWGEGPWNNEEDHGVWIDSATGLDCMINRGPSGALCGYVGVPPSHPWHGLKYDAVDFDITVHGGLTYSNACQEDGEICHIPEEGREHDIWWFGFDCAHAMDVAPRMDADMRQLNERLKAEGKEGYDVDAVNESLSGMWAKHYRDWAYVTNEVIELAWQLVQVTE